MDFINLKLELNEIWNNYYFMIPQHSQGMNAQGQSNDVTDYFKAFQSFFENQGLSKFVRSRICESSNEYTRNDDESSNYDNGCNSDLWWEWRVSFIKCSVELSTSSADNKP